VAELLLFHHAQALTAGCLSFADRLSAAGHGDHHLFADNSLSDHDESAATLLKQRVLSFLDDIA
jgi:hypothetical protein